MRTAALQSGLVRTDQWIRVEHPSQSGQNYRDERVGFSISFDLEPFCLRNVRERLRLCRIVRDRLKCDYDIFAIAIAAFFLNVHVIFVHDIWSFQFKSSNTLIPFTQALPAWVDFVCCVFTLWQSAWLPHRFISEKIWSYHIPMGSGAYSLNAIRVVETCIQNGEMESLD